MMIYDFIWNSLTSKKQSKFLFDISDFQIVNFSSNDFSFDVGLAIFLDEPWRLKFRRFSFLNKSKWSCTLSHQIYTWREISKNAFLTSKNKITFTFKYIRRLRSFTFSKTNTLWDDINEFCSQNSLCHTAEKIF